MDRAALTPSQSYNFSERATVYVCAESPFLGLYADEPMVGLPQLLPAQEPIEAAKRVVKHIF